MFVKIPTQYYGNITICDISQIGSKKTLFKLEQKPQENTLVLIVLPLYLLILEEYFLLMHATKQLQLLKHAYAKCFKAMVGPHTVKAIMGTSPRIHEMGL